MKKTIIFFTILFAVLISCSKNNSENLSKRSFAVFSGKTLDIVPTKANVNLSVDTRLGVYVLNATAGLTETFSTAMVKNSLYTIAADGSFTGNIIYLNTGKDYDVYSYGPRVDAIADETSISFSHNTDVIWAPVNTSVRGAVAGQNNVALQYVHKTSQIKFSLTDDRDNASKIQYPFAGATFEITGFCSQLSLNLNNGSITKGAVDNSIKITTQNTPVCFASNNGAPMSLTVNVTIPGSGGGSQSYNGVLTASFEQGYSYSYNIKLASTTLVMTGTITDWITVPVEDFVILPS
ncbi:MAG: fimbrillin family protein [Bacteroidales bacterium]